MRILYVLSLLCVLAEAPHAAHPIVLARPEQIRPEFLTQQWDARAKNMIYIINPDWGDDLIGLQIFADLLVPQMPVTTRRFSVNRVINVDLFQWTQEGQGWRFHIRQEEGLRFEINGRIYPEGQIVRLEADITNLDNYDWGGYASGAMCLRTGFSPRFKDPRGERIFVRDDAGVENNLKTVVGENWRYFRLAVANPEGDYLGWIKRANQDQSKWIEFISDPCLCLGGNHHPSFDSVQCDFQLDVGPGQTQHLQASLGFNVSLEPRRIIRPLFQKLTYNSKGFWGGVRALTWPFAIYAGLSLLASLLAYAIYRWRPAPASGGAASACAQVPSVPDPEPGQGPDAPPEAESGSRTDTDLS